MSEKPTCKLELPTSAEPMCPVCWKLVGSPIIVRSIGRRLRWKVNAKITDIWCFHEKWQKQSLSGSSHEHQRLKQLRVWENRVGQQKYGDWFLIHTAPSTFGGSYIKCYHWLLLLNFKKRLIKLTSVANPDKCVDNHLCNLIADVSLIGLLGSKKSLSPTSPNECRNQ